MVRLRGRRLVARLAVSFVLGAVIPFGLLPLTPVAREAAEAPPLSSTSALVETSWSTEEIVRMAMELAPPVRGGPATVYWVFAHPDDETLAAAGAIVRSMDAGNRNIVVIVSSGENTAVRQRLALSRERAAALRAAETRAALAMLGIQDVRFVGVPDGQVTARGVGQLLDDLLREGGKEALFRGHSPYDSYLGLTCGHPDHCAIGTALLQAWRDGKIANLKFYRVGQFFGGPLGEECETLDARQLSLKKKMKEAYTLPDRAAGRVGIGGQSVPTAWVRATQQPECADLPR